MNENIDISGLDSKRDLLEKKLFSVSIPYIQNYVDMDPHTIFEICKDASDRIWTMIFDRSEPDISILLDSLISLDQLSDNSSQLVLHDLESSGTKGTTSLLNLGTSILWILCQNEYWEILDQLGYPEVKLSERSVIFKLSAAFLVIHLKEHVSVGSNDIFDPKVIEADALDAKAILAYILFSVAFLLILSLSKCL